MHMYMWMHMNVCASAIQAEASCPIVVVLCRPKMTMNQGPNSSTSHTSQAHVWEGPEMTMNQGPNSSTSQTSLAHDWCRPEMTTNQGPNSSTSQTSQTSWISQAERKIIEQIVANEAHAIMGAIDELSLKIDGLVRKLEGVESKLDSSLNCDQRSAWSSGACSSGQSGHNTPSDLLNLRHKAQSTYMVVDQDNGSFPASSPRSSGPPSMQELHPSIFRASIDGGTRQAPPKATLCHHHAHFERGLPEHFSFSGSSYVLPEGLDPWMSHLGSTLFINDTGGKNEAWRLLEKHALQFRLDSTITPSSRHFLLFCKECGCKTEGHYGRWATDGGAQSQSAQDALLSFLGVKLKRERGNKDSTCHLRRQAKLAREPSVMDMDGEHQR